VDWEHHDFTPRHMHADLLSVVLGPIADGEPQLNVSCWPIDPDQWQDANVHDGRQDKFLVDWLGLDQVAWGYALHKASRRTRDRRFSRLVSEIARELEQTGELHQPELNAIAERVP
jgi:hypothetical protein